VEADRGDRGDAAAARRWAACCWRAAEAASRSAQERAANAPAAVDGATCGRSHAGGAGAETARAAAVPNPRPRRARGGPGKHRGGREERSVAATIVLGQGHGQADRVTRGLSIDPFEEAARRARNDEPTIAREPAKGERACRRGAVLAAAFPAAAAAPSEAERTARAHFQAGEAHFKAGAFDEALKRISGGLRRETSARVPDQHRPVPAAARRSEDRARDVSEVRSGGA
jgi:hypothetical protein